MDSGGADRDGRPLLSLSIVIPARDAADTLGAQLDALARQRWEGDWEVIVADNGSRDATVALAESYRERFPRLTVLDASARPGAGYARNQAARVARGDALLFCDADDEVGEGWLETMGRCLERHTAVASCFDPVKLNPPEVVRVRSCPQRQGIQSYQYPPYLPHAGTSGLAVHRELHEAIGGFDESFYRLQDTDYCWRLQLAGAQLHFEPAAVVHVRYRSNGRASYRQARQWGEFNVKLYKKFRPHGMPAISPRERARTCWRLVRRVPHTWYAERRRKWLWEVNWMLGRMKGSLKYRVFGI